MLRHIDREEGGPGQNGKKGKKTFTYLIRNWDTQGEEENPVKNQGEKN